MTRAGNWLGIRDKSVHTEGTKATRGREARWTWEAATHYPRLSHFHEAVAALPVGAEVVEGAADLGFG